MFPVVAQSSSPLRSLTTNSMLIQTWNFIVFRHFLMKLLPTYLVDVSDQNECDELVEPIRPLRIYNRSGVAFISKIS